MKTPIKNLAKQTAIYGASSIFARLLNYLLTPYFTSIFDPDVFGIITEMYSYVAFLVVFLMYGMETAYFKYINKDGYDKNNVFTTVVFSLISTSTLFISLSVFFADSISEWLKYPNNQEFVIWFAFIVGLDAISSIALARLRAESKAKRFAIVNLANVFINITLNLFFLSYCKVNYDNGVSNFFIDTFYSPEINVGYVFISNLIASIVKFLILIPEFLKARYKVEMKLLRDMLIYALPLLIYGLSGIINETLDKIMFKRMLIDHPDWGEKETMWQLGIYGANYKLSIIITMFLQAYRYAAEPFFFANEKKKESPELYSKVMTYFVIICFTIALGVLLYLDIFKYFIPNQLFWEGLKVVPILMGANVCLGIYYNQSIWYKLSDKTSYGAYLGVFGALITIVLNYVWIPVYGYIGCAYATLVCYFSMMIVSYILGQKHYPIPYNIKRILLYSVLAIGIYFISISLDLEDESISKFGVNTLLFAVFVFTAFKLEKSSFKKS